MSKAPVIAVVGPSGVGKDSVMQALAARDPGLRLVRRVVTRPAGAADEDFTRVTEAEFARLCADGAFALSWRAHGLCYGIPAQIEALRAEAAGVVVNLSRSVLLDAQDRFGELIVLSLTAAPAVLARRLHLRGREDGADRARRLQRAAAPVPEGLKRVCRIDNSGALDHAVTAALACIRAKLA